MDGVALQVALGPLKLKRVPVFGARGSHLSIDKVSPQGRLQGQRFFSLHTLSASLGKRPRSAVASNSGGLRRYNDKPSCERVPPTIRRFDIPPSLNRTSHFLSLLVCLSYPKCHEGA